MTEKTTNRVTLGEVYRKLDDHIERQDEFEREVFRKIEDLNLILRVFKWIGWILTVGISTAIIWAVNTFLNRG